MSQADFNRRQRGYWTARAATAIMILLLALLGYQLLLGRGSVVRVNQMKKTLDAQIAKNAAAKMRNDQLAAEVDELKEGLDGVEEQARGSLGMVKPNEILVQITPSTSKTTASTK